MCRSEILRTQKKNSHHKCLSKHDNIDLFYIVQILSNLFVGRYLKVFIMQWLKITALLRDHIKMTFEHDKTNKMSVRSAKTQLSLGIRPVWSESLLSAWRNLGSLATQADLSLCWPNTHFVAFVMSRLICFFDKAHICWSNNGYMIHVTRKHVFREFATR